MACSPPPISLSRLKPNTVVEVFPSDTPTTSTLRIPATIFLHQIRCKSFREVAQLHAQLLVSGLFISRPTTAGNLIHSYLSISYFDYASSVFSRIVFPDVFAYNTMIRGFTEHNQPYHSLLLYNQMLLEGLVPDNYTYTRVFKACARANAFFEGKQVHCQVIKTRKRKKISPPDTHVHSSLIHMYSNSSDCLHSAQLVLKEFTEENTLINNSMISGYFRHGCTEEAKGLFDGTAGKDAASWSAMVSGYTKNGMHVEALNVFRKMIACQTTPNESMVVSAVTACARLGALDQGRWIHMYANRIGLEISLTLGTALVDMYAKSGSIDDSYEIFKKMPRRDVVTWGAMISGFAMHGQAQKCFKLFDEMVGSGIRPNAIIFVAILSACSHVGYVKAGHHYFNQMVQSFGIKPSIEHYGCMVDLLGRAGRLAEAEELMLSMPEEPNSIIWGALLAACRTHKDLQRGKRAFRCLLQLEPRSGDRYKLAGQMFAASGDKEEAIEVMKLIKEKEMETTCGSSFIEVDGRVHEFMVGDTCHSEAEEIYMMLEEIKRKLEEPAWECRAEGTE
ncbi:Pentatricopeptide repeat [Macleaya cordata]|uniref:Pentatricopeptide repeat n=1 Tax=Macleaya cordata TaxID=56857 RepID=A0A200RAE4_MACCD|nr:Pentatricopeptide repeat [Macleaya cordata]